MLAPAAYLGCGAGLGALAGHFVTDRCAGQKTRQLSRRQPAPVPAPAGGYADGVAEDQPCEWLNDLVRILWPRIDDFLNVVLHEQVLPAIDEALPAMRGAVKVTKLTLGDATPYFSRFRVKERNDKAVVLDLNVDISTELDVRIKALGVPVGVKEFIFRGDLTVVFRPKVPHPPFFGGVEVFFINPPMVDMDFTGAAAVADFKAFNDVVQGAIGGALSQYLVVPARVAIDLLPDDAVDEAELRCPEPIGVLRLLLKGAKGLKAADTHLVHRPSSDPYVLVRLGQQVWRSPTQKRTLEPIWAHANICDFLVYEAAQLATFSVFDEDQVTQDDLLGVASLAPVEHLLEPGRAAEQTLPLRLEEEAAGELTFSMRWFELSRSIPVSGIPQAVAKGPSQLLVQVKVISVSDLPPDSLAPFVVRFGAGKIQSMDTRKSNPGRVPSNCAEQLVRICTKLSAQGKPVAEVAEITGMAPKQVEAALLQSKDPKAAEGVLRTWNQQRASCNPRFDDIVRLLLPWTGEMMEHAMVTLELQDKKGRRVGNRFEKLLRDVARQDVVVAHPVLPGAVLRAQLSTRWLSIP